MVSEVYIIKNAVLNSWMNKVKDLNKYDDVKLAEIRYGLEGFYLTITKLIIIFLISLLLGTTKYTLLFLAFSIPIRTLSSGFHANTSLQCLIMSTLAFILIPLLANYFTLNGFAKCIIFFCLIIGYWIMSPKDTEKKPIVNNKKRFWLKVASVILVFIYFGITIFLRNQFIINLMILSLIFQLFMISPIPFVLYGQKYNFKWFK